MSTAIQRSAARAPRLAFVGLGWIGRQRLEALAATGTVEPIACVDADRMIAAREAAAHPPARGCATLEAALALEPDGIVIATPSGLHEEQALAALECGVAVFCQKPIAATAAGAARVIERAASRDRLLDADFCYRHVAGMQALRERLRAGELGEILAIDLTFHNAYAPAAAWSRDRTLAGGGCLLDLGIHLLDLAAWLQDFVRLEVVGARLFAGGTALGGRDVPEDLAFAELRQANGACVRLACSWNLHAGQGAIIGLDIHGTRGGASWGNVAGSFVDFELRVNRGDRHEVVACGPDDWGPRALVGWAQRLAADNRFDPAARSLVASAELVDAIYARARSDA